MRAYTLSYLGALWFCGLAACTEETDPTDAGGEPKRDAAPGHDAGDLDAGPVQCDTRGLWQITFDKSDDRCLPRTQAWMYKLSVGRDDVDTVTEVARADGECGPRREKVMISSEGCAVRALLLSTSCSNGEPQCQEYQLELAVHGNTADVAGTYRHCWCSSPAGQGGGWMGSVVPITGEAVRL